MGDTIISIAIAGLLILIANLELPTIVIILLGYFIGAGVNQFVFNKNRD